jgi:hypothetical protein
MVLRATVSGVAAATAVLPRKAPVARGLRVEWPDNLRAVEDALHEVPDSTDWPGLFPALLHREVRGRRTAIVISRDGPVAVVLLRCRSRATWEPVTQWIVPGFLFPAREGHTLPALATLGLVVNVGWWRFPTLPPEPSMIVHELTAAPVHRIACNTEFEGFWKTTGNLDMVRRAARRCRDFALRINPPGGAEWIIRNWERQWRQESGTPARDLDDRLTAAATLEKVGSHFSLVLFDKAAPVAGATLMIHRRSAVAGVLYRESGYNYQGVGTHLIAEVCRWAARSGYAELDIGGDHDYKKLWAPVGGYKYEFTVSPMWLHVLHTMARRAMRVVPRLAGG